jgi:hypothetical protein
MDQNEEYELVRDAVFEHYNVPRTYSMDRHFAVLMGALVIRGQRAHHYADSYQRFGWIDSLFHMRGKLLRLVNVFGKPKEGVVDYSMDDAIDLINYTVFFIHNVQDKNPGEGSVEL